MTQGNAMRARWAAGAALGVWMLVWAWAAEAHEPSRTGGAPSAAPVPAGGVEALAAADAPLAVSPLAGGSVLLATPSGSTPVLLAQTEGQVVHRQWNRRSSKPKPQPQPPRRPPEPRGWVTLRGGYFDADGAATGDWVAGFKITGRVGSVFQAGIATDWQRRTETGIELIESHSYPGGSPVYVGVPRYESASNLVPILAVLEARPYLGPVQPYMGVGMGYEAMVVEIRDYALGIRYYDHFGGFGWQPYGGLAVALDRRVHLVGEAYGNFSTVSRTVRDYDTGLAIKQKIDADGFGFRGGLSFAF